LRQFENVIPIWGMQKMSELNEFLLYENEPPMLDDTLRESIEADRTELSGSFCRSCGYCLPCPANIPIPTAARITFLIRRTIKQNWLTPEWRKNMRLIDDCTACGHCKQHCPYGLDTPSLLKSQQQEYFKIAAEG
jgi:predicted aldo/keto reductase-like oxidoreductase